jgi:4-diphosphocytidyl-2-C-methyl-D-erythritol kinase
MAKINLGLNVVERRADGYHNLETVFYPVPIADTLEVQVMDDAFLSPTDCDLKVTGICIEGNEEDNLVVRAYRMLKRDYPHLPRVHTHLHKAIPTQAGMGGGSSDCAAMIVLLNKQFGLGLHDEQMEHYAARLGADCAFFIKSKPAYAEGIGEQLFPIHLNLQGWHLLVVRPDIPVSTKEAFALVTPRRPAVNCRSVVEQPVEQWRETLVNDFEQSVFTQYPAIGHIKQELYDMGAAYAAMSGSGSALFALFAEAPTYEGHFKGMYVRSMLL